MNIRDCITKPLSRKIVLSLCYIRTLSRILYHAGRLDTTSIESYIIPVFVIEDSILKNPANRGFLLDLAEVIRNNVNIATPIPIIFPLSMEENAKSYIEELENEIKKIKINDKKPSVRYSYEKLIHPATRMALRTYLLSFIHLKGTHKIFLVKEKLAWKPFEEVVNAAVNTFWTSKVNPQLAFDLLRRPTGGPDKPDSLALRPKREEIEALVVDAKLRTFSNNWIETVYSGRKEESIEKYAKYLKYAKKEFSRIKINSIALLFVFRDKEPSVRYEPLVNAFKEVGYDDVYFYDIMDLVKNLE